MSHENWHPTKITRYTVWHSIPILGYSINIPQFLLSTYRAQSSNRTAAVNELSSWLLSQKPECRLPASRYTMSSTVTKLRTETLHKVLPATSLNNVYSDAIIPQNPKLATNSYSNAHQDSWQSETVGVSGPNSGDLRLIIQNNPYGSAPNMTCNANNQMIALSVLGTQFYLVVFDTECKIISSTNTGQGSSGTLAGGYFFLNSDDNAVVVSGAGNTLACYPTSDVHDAGGIGLQP